MIILVFILTEFPRTLQVTLLFPSSRGGGEELQIACVQFIGHPAVTSSQLLPPSDLRCFSEIEASQCAINTIANYNDYYELNCVVVSVHSELFLFSCPGDGFPVDGTHLPATLTLGVAHVTHCSQLKVCRSDSV